LTHIKASEDFWATPVAGTEAELLLNKAEPALDVSWSRSNPMIHDSIIPVSLKLIS